MCTVKPVYKDHSGDQQMMVSVDRWSLCRGEIRSIALVVLRPAYSGLYRQVVLM